MLPRMYKSQHRNTRNRNEEGNMTPQKEHNITLILDYEEEETDEMLEKEFERMMVRLLKNRELDGKMAE